MFMLGVQAVEVIPVMHDDLFRFPIIDDDLSQPGPKPPYIRKRKPPVNEIVPPSQQIAVDDEDRNAGGDETEHVPADQRSDSNSLPDLESNDEDKLDENGEPRPISPTDPRHPDNQDYWTITPDAIVRHHRVPR